MASIWPFSVLCLMLYVSWKGSAGEPDGLTADELALLKRLLGEQNQERNHSSSVIVEHLKDIFRNETFLEESDELARAGDSLSSKCAAGEIQCRSSDLCIQGEWECDGIVDCPSESDEIGCFECIHDPNGRLLPQARVCDDVADCAHGEDERMCKSACDYLEMKCDEFNVNSLCVPKEWTCDAYPDCPGLTDESVELCGNLSDRCRKHEFICGHELFCIPEEWRCDLSDDCGDNSDEDGCDDEKSFEEEFDFHEVINGDYKWGEWGNWSSCSAKCDGEQIRTRRCETKSCAGKSVEVEACGEPYPCMEEPSSGCGTRSFDIPNGRVVGGADAQLHEWPWQIQMFRPEKTIPFCGGTLINWNWVLTAAHCFNKKRYPPEKYTIALARQHTSRRVADDDAVFIRGKKLIIHKSYKKTTHRDDIALMELARSVQSTPGINVVCLPTPNYDWFRHQPEGSPDCYVTGFGINEIGKRPSVLQEAHVQLINHETCSAPHVYGNKITKSMLCAGHLEGGIDACQGDSGGPLACQHQGDGRWYQVGLTSWGKGCGLPNRPGVYTRISRYIDWIESNIKRKR